MSHLLRYCAAVLGCAGLAVLLSPGASAQSTALPDSFDLVLVGDSLAPAPPDVALRTNPTMGEQWEPLGDARCEDAPHLLVLSNQPTDRYLGQDLREHHLTLKLTAETKAAALRAVYAVPATPSMDESACARLAQLATERPSFVRRRSLAAYERPRPAGLSPGEPFIDHVEAPVRHRKPGVLEVEWLKVLFGPAE